MASGQGNVPVTLKLIDENDFLHTGKIDFIDNVINHSSGTIRGRAVFANPDGLFTPGMFGRVRVPGSPPIPRCSFPTPRSVRTDRANMCWSSTTATWCGTNM